MSHHRARTVARGQFVSAIMVLVLQLYTPLNNILCATPAQPCTRPVARDSAPIGSHAPPAHCTSEHTPPSAISKASRSTRLNRPPLNPKPPTGAPHHPPLQKASATPPCTSQIDMLSAGYDFRYGNVWLKRPDGCDPGVRAAIMLTPPVTNICELLPARTPFPVHVYSPCR